MKYKRFLFLFLTVLLVSYFIIGFIIYVIDPDGINNKYKYNLNKIKLTSSKFTIPYYINNLEQNKFILVFGTSRALRFSSKILNFNVMKPHHVYGNPHCVLSFLNQLSFKEEKNIKSIYYNLSNLAFNEKTNCELVNYREITTLDNYFMNISFKNIKKVYQTILVNINNKKLLYKVNEFGSITDINNKDFFPKVIKNDHYFVKKLENEKELQVVTDDTFKALKEIDMFCKNNNIKITYFTDALTDYQISLMDYKLTKKFHKKLLESIDEYYGLNYIENFSNNYKYFFEKSHINTKGAKYIVKNIFNIKNYVINKNNVDTYLIYLQEKYKESKIVFNNNYLLK